MKIKPKQFLFNCILFFLIFSIILIMFDAYINVKLITTVANVIQFGSVFLCLAYFIIIFKEKSILMNKICILLFIMACYELTISLLTNSFYIKYTLEDICLWPLIIIVFYDYVSKNEFPKIGKKIIKISYFIIFILSALLIRNRLMGIDNLGKGVYYSYFCLTFLLLSLKVFKSDFFKKSGLIFSIIFLILSTKRAGVIAAVFCSLVYIITDAHIQKNTQEKIKKYFKIFLILLVSFIIIVYVANNYDIAILHRFKMLSSDGGSGRSEIWNIVLTKFSQSSFIEKIFGHGYQSVYYKVMPRGYYSMAHNCYIEYLYDYGIIGVSMLITFVMKLVNVSIRLFKKRNINALYMCSSLAIVLVLSNFSYLFEQSIVILPLAIIWGYCMGENKKFKVNL